MMGMLLIGVASFGLATAEPNPTSVTCTATAPGVTFTIGSGLMCFHYDTTCDGTVSSITIDATYSGPAQGSGSKTCLDASSCSYVLCTPYRRGTWSFTNATTYSGGTSSATNTVTYNP
ncbi:hypothetical protein [Hyalangium versicolor]|uniref:hypothetical protein n=1 Tax=Hyalangium versicolor TaxID=2861190 RepID=UPI001CCD97E4|nr:hypothetical protein [Hyalangium versicolor]